MLNDDQVWTRTRLNERFARTPPAAQCAYKALIQPLGASETIIMLQLIWRRTSQENAVAKDPLFVAAVPRILIGAGLNFSCIPRPVFRAPSMRCSFRWVPACHRPSMR